MPAIGASAIQPNRAAIDNTLFCRVIVVLAQSLLITQ
jgi:hypothetical protein